MRLEKINSMFKKRSDLKLYNKLYDNDGEAKIAMQYLNNMNGEDRTEIVL